MNELQSLLTRHLADWRSGWSMGSSSAIAAFHQNAGELAVIDEPANLTRATRRGGVRITTTALTNIVPVAYETLCSNRRGWGHALALCLPQTLARRSARQVLTEIGPDDNPIRGIDRPGILFDMGLALPQCDFCIRTSDPKLLAVLRANLGISVFDPANTAMAAVLAAHPHRIALTNIGRVEVYQQIGSRGFGGIDCAAPSAHALPKPLRDGRTHFANAPIPIGLLPLGALHPGNPVGDDMGKPFDTSLHEAFQALLVAYGSAEGIAAKFLVNEALRDRTEPHEVLLPVTTLARMAARMALRQAEHLAQPGDRAELRALIDRWRRALEGANEPSTRTARQAIGRRPKEQDDATECPQGQSR